MTYAYPTTFTEAWLKALSHVARNGHHTAPRGHSCYEVLAYTLSIPTCKSRTLMVPERAMSPFYMAGELLWYLLGDNTLNFISYYSSAWNRCSDDGRTLNSAYGARIFSGHKYPKIGFNQFNQVVETLRNDPDSRQAIIHLHTPNNEPTKDEVCTLSLQFFIRDQKLIQHVTMRSNDCMWGTTYDVYFFTILQELLASYLGVECGAYYHTAGSLHLYDKDKTKYIACINSQLDVEYTGPFSTKPLVYDSTFIHDLTHLAFIEYYYRHNEANKDVFTHKNYTNLICTLPVFMYSKLQSQAAKEIAILLFMYSIYKRHVDLVSAQITTRELMTTLHNKFKPYLTKETNLLVTWTGAKQWT